MKNILLTKLKLFNIGPFTEVFFTVPYSLKMRGIKESTLTKFTLIMKHLDFNYILRFGALRIFWL